MKKALILILIAGALTLAFSIGRQTAHNSPVAGLKAKVDTLYLRDTITAYEPIFVERRKVDSVRVPVIDSVTIHDTLYVYLEREQVVWQDSLSRVYASGVMPHIDSVQHFVSYQIIEKTTPVKVRSKWGLGIQAGMGAGKAGLTPYIGVGISYNLLSW